MQTLDQEKQALLERISKTVEALMQRHSIYREYSLDADKIIQSVFKMFDENFSIDELNARPDIYFTEIIDAEMMTELLVVGEEDLSEDISKEWAAVKARISAIVDHLFQSNSLFAEKLNKPEMIEILLKLFPKLPLDKIRKMSDQDLIDRINGVLVIEAVSGTLNDLTPEEIKMFDAAVEGR